MLQITGTATEQLKKTLADLDTHEDVCLRLSETQEGLRIVLNQRRSGDATVKNDEALLVIDTCYRRRNSRSAGRPHDGFQREHQATALHLTEPVCTRNANGRCRRLVAVGDLVACRRKT